MKNIDSFIKGKLKSKKMRVDDFIKETEMSKSTIYRVMKGIQKPSEELIEKIALVLNLNQLEKNELIYYSNISTNSENTSEVGDSIFNMLYGERKGGLNDRIELVYYDGEKYVRYLDEIFEKIASYSLEDSFVCKMRIINCTQESIVSEIIKFGEKLYENDAYMDIEHLISLSTENKVDNVNIFGQILPLMQLDRYILSYSDSAVSFAEGMFNNVVVVDFSYKSEDLGLVSKKLVISILDENLSSCYISDYKSNFSEFFDRNYDSVCRQYKIALDNRKDINILGQTLLELEGKYDSYLFKPNPCYNRIEKEVYMSLSSRMSSEEIGSFIKSLSDINLILGTPNEEQNEVLDSIFDYMDARVGASHERNQVDIFTSKGLEEFVETGRLTDHLSGLPAFNKEEIGRILSNIKKRHLDKSDKYKFYIVKEGYNNEDFVLTVFKDYGFMVEYNHPNKIADNHPYCLLKNKSMGDLFYEFTKTYIPTIGSMSEKNAMKFIDDLISRCS